MGTPTLVLIAVTTLALGIDALLRRRCLGATPAG